MRSRSSPSVLAVFLVTSVTLFALGCSQVAATPIKHPDIAECGGPMAKELAKRAANVVFAYAGQPGTTAADLERLIASEIKSVAGEFGPGFAGCLIQKVLDSQRSPLAAHPSQPAALPRRYRLIAPQREIEPFASVGFVPIERAPGFERPWHTLLAGARGVRS